MRYQNVDKFNYKYGTNSKGLKPREQDADKVSTPRGERRKARGAPGYHKHEWIMWKFSHGAGVKNPPSREANEQRFYCKECGSTSRTAK